MNPSRVLTVLLLCLLFNVSHGETTDEEQESDADNYGNNKASSETGVVGANVEMTGYAVINGEVWIDGVKIHKPQSVYISKKSGKTYRISWRKNGNVDVTEK